MIGGRYQLGEALGAGGMGTVYRGLDTQTGQPVAIKNLRSDLADPANLARFKREGEALRHLNHPNVVKMLDGIEENGQHYLIMELVEGGTLSDLKQPPLPRLLEIALDLADALTRAHRLNIIHRDLKPSNVLLAPDGTPRLTDFGIARTKDSQITETGMVIGTLAYLSPEALNGAEIDPKADIWAFGVLLFELLTGQAPFRGDSVGALIAAILSQPVPDLEQLRPDAPPALVDLIYRMLVKNAAERIPSVRLVGAELEAILGGNASVGVRHVSPLQDDDLTISTKSTFLTPTPSQPLIKHNLPTQSTPFVGREHELEELITLLDDPATRLLTILAPGGMGKTRLSLEVGKRYLSETTFPDGIYLVELAPLTSADTIPTVLAETVGYPFQADGRDPQQQLVDFFREKQQLLLLDNFEHVIAGADLVNAILKAAPGVKILATSRERLNLSGEVIFGLAGLAFPQQITLADALEYSAIKLFIHSARRSRPNFEMTDGEIKEVIQICQQVHGTPLGIVLAAGWLEMLTVQEIATEIAQSLDFLESELRDMPSRQRSLRAVFEYSWNLLREEERHAFMQLAVFRGGFTREAAQQVTGANLRTLQNLVNKSILRRDLTTGRYFVHELLRQYAEDHLKQAAGLSATQAAHSAYYLSWLAEQENHLKGHQQQATLKLIEGDFENLRTAWLWAAQHGEADHLDQAADGLYLYCHLRSRFYEGGELFQLAHQALPPHTPVWGKLLARGFRAASDPLVQVKTALQLAQTPYERAFCYELMGDILTTQARLEEALDHYEQSLAEYRADGKLFNLGRAMQNTGYIYTLLGQAESKARSYYEESLALRQQMGDTIGEAWVNIGLGGIIYYSENYHHSSEYILRSYELFQHLGDRYGYARAACFCGIINLLSGETAKSQRFIEDVRRIAQEINSQEYKGTTLGLEGIAATLEGNYDKGVRLLQESLAVVPYPPVSLETRLWLVLAMWGAEARLQPVLGQMLHVAQMIQSTFMSRRCLWAAAAWYFQRGKPQQAAEFLGLGLASPYPLPIQATWEPLLQLQADLQSALGETAYQAALERGKTLPIIETINQLYAEWTGLEQAT